MNTHQSLSRFHWLDGLRGIAALVVVLFHWQHFWINHKTSQFDPTQMPLSWLLAPLASEGWLAVDLFFTLSGFVFFSVYSQTVANRKVSGMDYFIARISRIYPLHLVTLVAVACLQSIYYSLQERFFVYPINTWKHFVLQLSLTNFWFPRTAVYSFNGPMWSISVEVFLYLAFFILCRRRLNQLWLSVLLVAVGLLIKVHFNFFLGKGIVGFFAGASAYHFVCWALCNRLTAILMKFAAICVPVASLLVSQFLVGPAFELLFELLTWPAVVVLLATWRSAPLFVVPACDYLGKVSFAIYLWHFPLQIFYAIAEYYFKWPIESYYSPYMLISFIIILMSIATASYYLMERPIQSNLRRRFLRQ